MLFQHEDQQNIIEESSLYLKGNAAQLCYKALNS
jgi:hypothetical protein